MDIRLLFRRPEVELLIRMVRVPASQEDAERVASILRGEIDWSAFLRHARQHGVLPLVYRYVNVHDRLPIPSYVVQLLREHYLSNGRLNLLKTGILFRVLRRLEHEKVIAIPYKGPTLALMAYRDLGLREFGDLDLLIPWQDLGRARAALLSDGFRVANRVTAAQEQRLLRHKGQLPLLLYEQHLLELHQELFHPSFGFRMNHSLLEARLKPVCVAGHPVLTCCPEDTLLILAAHGAKHFWGSLGWLCDLAGLIHHQPTLDWNAMILAANASGGKRIFSLGIFLAREFLAAPVPSDAMSSINEEATLPSIAASISRWLFAASRPTAWEKAWFLLRVRDRVQDGFRDLLSRLLTLPQKSSRAVSLARE